MAWPGAGHRCPGSVLVGGGFDGEDGDRGAEEDALGGAAEDEFADRAAAAEPEDDEADVLVGSRLEEFAGDVGAPGGLVDRSAQSAEGIGIGSRE